MSVGTSFACSVYYEPVFTNLGALLLGYYSFNVSYETRRLYKEFDLFSSPKTPLDSKVIHVGKLAKAM